MIYQYKFEKILTIKEKEKRDALSKYNAALKTFEKVAEKLYKLLKKKKTFWNSSRKSSEMDYPFRKFAIISYLWTIWKSS